MANEARKSRPTPGGPPPLARQLASCLPARLPQPLAGIVSLAQNIVITYTFTFQVCLQAPLPCVCVCAAGFRPCPGLQMSVVQWGIHAGATHPGNLPALPHSHICLPGLPKP